eukprot:2802401-Rhodomonas_salina.5
MEEKVRLCAGAGAGALLVSVLPLLLLEAWVCMLFWARLRGSSTRVHARALVCHGSEATLADARTNAGLGRDDSRHGRRPDHEANPHQGPQA